MMDTYFLFSKDSKANLERLFQRCLSDMSAAIGAFNG